MHTFAPPTYTAALQPCQDPALGWIGWIEEIPGVNCQEPTREALLESLRITLAEALEMNKQDALSHLSGPYFEEPIAVYAH